MQAAADSSCYNSDGSCVAATVDLSIFARLPPELLVAVFYRLEVKEICLTVCSVCRQWANLAIGSRALAAYLLALWCMGCPEPQQSADQLEKTFLAKSTLFPTC